VDAAGGHPSSPQVNQEERQQQEEGTIGVKCSRMVQAKLVFDLDQFGLKSGALDKGKSKWVVSNMAGTRTYANLGVSDITP
jgi:hypothetical protein